MGANEWLGGNYVKVDAKADSDALFKNPKAEAVQAEAAKNAAEAAKSRQYDAPLPERLLHWTIVLAAQGAWVGFAYSAVAKCLAPGCACSWYNLVTGFAAGLLIQGGGGGGVVGGGGGREASLAWRLLSASHRIFTCNLLEVIYSRVTYGPPG
jgi:hypothetical protein